MDIETRVEKIEKRMAELEEKIQPKKFVPEDSDGNKYIGLNIEKGSNGY